MGFWVVYSLTAFLCIILTSLPLVGYCDCDEWIKILVYVFLSICWFSPIVIWNLQAKRDIPVKLYAVAAKVGYFLEGFAFLLMMVLLARDVLWWSLYYFSSGLLVISPLVNNIIVKANIITVLAVFIISLGGVYAAERLPKVLRYSFSDNGIKMRVRMLAVSDLHITKMTSISKVKSWVKFFNSLNANIVVFSGDVADDQAGDINTQIKELKKIKAPLGIYYVLGNHETYFNPYVWEAEFSALGWQVLHNSGAAIADTGIYIGGVPDNRAFPVSVAQSMRNAQKNDYCILLSHLPSTIKEIGNNKIDLLICGHTHGGQIFPFNLLAKLGNNGLVAGLYRRENTTVLVSRGAGYWGPPIRVGAPNDVMLIELLPNS